MKIFDMKKAFSRLSGAFVFLLVLLLPSLAFAQDAPAAPPTAIQEFGTQVMNILVPVFVTLIGSLATWLMLKVQKKLGLQLSEKTQQQWADLARQAALRGAEWARKKTKELTDGKKLPGGEVMDVAAKWALQMAEHQKLPALAREKLEGLIEVELFKLRREQSLENPNADAKVPATV